MAFSGVRVSGLRELQRAFALYSDEEKKALRARLAEVAEPVRARAQDLAGGDITNITDDWSEMRIGVTNKSAYVAPKHRRTSVASRARPNLAPLLLDAEMTGLEETQPAVVAGLEAMLGDLGDLWALV